MATALGTLQSHVCEQRGSKWEFAVETQSIVVAFSFKDPVLRRDRACHRDTSGFHSRYPSKNKTNKMSRGRIQRKEAAVPSAGEIVCLLTVGMCVWIPSCWWQPCTRLSPSTMHKASPSMEQSSQAWCNPVLGGNPADSYSPQETHSWSYSTGCSWELKVVMSRKDYTGKWKTCQQGETLVSLVTYRLKCYCT